MNISLNFHICMGWFWDFSFDSQFFLYVFLNQTLAARCFAIIQRIINRSICHQEDYSVQLINKDISLIDKVCKDKIHLVARVSTSNVERF
jgi:hypothetical protein